MIMTVMFELLALANAAVHFKALLLSERESVRLHPIIRLLLTASAPTVAPGAGKQAHENSFQEHLWSNIHTLGLSSLTEPSTRACESSLYLRLLAAYEQKGFVGDILELSKQSRST